MKIYLKSILILILLKSTFVMAQGYDANGNVVTTQQQSQIVDNIVTSKNTIIYPATTAKNEASSLKVLIDQSKPRQGAAVGDYSTLIQLLNDEGYTVNVSTEGVLNLNLNDFDVILFGFKYTREEYSQAEIAAIKTYVDNGGGLVINGEASNCCSAGNQVLSDISKPIAGVSLSSTVTLIPTDLYFSNHTSHEIFTGVDQLYYRYAGAVEVDSPEYSLAKTDDGLHTLVALNNNVIAVSDDSFMTNSGRNYWGRADNIQFIKNIFNYLATGTVAGPDYDTNLSIEKRINNFDAPNQAQAVNLATGRLYRAQYTVTNNFDHRIYQVSVYDTQGGGEVFVCTLWSFEPGQSKTCENNGTTLSGVNKVPATVRALSSIDSSEYVNRAASWYEGHSKVTGNLVLQHYVDNKSADSPAQAVQVKAGDEIDWLFTVKNNTNIDIYRTRLYADGVTPVNTGWELQCFMGNLKAGAIRHCKVTTVAGESLHHVIGRVRSIDSPVGYNEKVVAENPTYYFGASD